MRDWGSSGDEIEVAVVMRDWGSSGDERLKNVSVINSEGINLEKIISIIH